MDQGNVFFPVSEEAKEEDDEEEKVTENKQQDEEEEEITTTVSLPQQCSRVMLVSIFPVNKGEEEEGRACPNGNSGACKRKNQND